MDYMEHFKLDNFVQLLEHYQGRDKFCRSIQYLALFYRWFFQDHDEELSNDFRILASYLRNTRKMIRLFESLNELHKISVIWNKIRSQQLHGTNRMIPKITLMLSRICYCIFWTLDNIKILVVVGFLKGNVKTLRKASFLVWFLGLFSSLIHNGMLLRLSYKSEAELKTTIVNNKTPKQLIQMLQDISSERFKILLNIGRNCGDLVIAIQQIGLARVMLKTNINYGCIACGGFLSSHIGLYQLYIKLKKQEKPPQVILRY